MPIEERCKRGVQLTHKRGCVCVCVCPMHTRASTHATGNSAGGTGLAKPFGSQMILSLSPRYQTCSRRDCCLLYRVSILLWFDYFLLSFILPFGTGMLTLHHCMSETCTLFFLILQESQLRDFLSLRSDSVLIPMSCIKVFKNMGVLKWPECVLNYKMAVCLWI